MPDHYVERVVDLTEPQANQLFGLTTEAARQIILNSPAHEVNKISGSFALVARCGKTVKMARSLDRPMRYFLAKRQEGPVLIVAHRIDAIYNWLKSEQLDGQFHPSYTRMVPAHHVVELQLIGCPDPDPVYTRFFTPQSNSLPSNLDEIGKAYISALAEEVSLWLRHLPASRTNWCVFFRRNRQRQRISNHLSRDAQTGHESVAIKSLRSGFWPRP